MMMAFAIAPDQFVLKSGQLAAHSASDSGIRKFCAQCGSPIVFESTMRRSYGVFAGTLDDAPRFKPDAQIYTSRRAAWPSVETSAEKLLHAGHCEQTFAVNWRCLEEHHCLVAKPLRARR
jgi:hypothetical protein